MNNINICPILLPHKNIKLNNIKNSLDYYYNETRNHIRTCLPIAIKESKKLHLKNYKYIINKLLTNEDLFNNIVTAIMIADSTWDNTKSSKKYWRTQNCIWTIGFILTHNKKTIYNYGILPIYNPPLEELILKEENDILQTKLDALDKRYKEILQAYYYNSLSQQEISKIFSISQQRVSEIISNARRKLRQD